MINLLNYYMIQQNNDNTVNNYDNFITIFVILLLGFPGKVRYWVTHITSFRRCKMYVFQKAVSKDISKDTSQKM